MQHDEFIGQVQARAHLPSRGAAETGTRATLETLAERIPATMAEKLAAQLPVELGEHLRRVEYAQDEPVTGVRMDRHEFFDRVARRARTDPPKAVHEARTVVELLEEATQGGLTERIRQSMDEETASVLFSGSTGTAGD
ncbi:DUF2267 domain-containing protein [Streptomyces albus]|uniref:DUF2267 domain-containing protein n=1 Tax=Streptomyces TaxID=1883 RepID=UPI00034E5A7E|nr:MULTISPECIES: DUF2267 domain-containing protein [Streptomyces]EPD93134.1 hypothetical protein HMPREF1486_04211 [Streptomyces sp. HPH0547]KPC68802.1 hypothetical protein ADL27_55320 [Streptomyces sp. NRRL F-6602]MDI6411715.1 DUF2267 domain-containing protein [Streptomyces albus]GHJ18669.1 hypothetical protein TPA0909_02830 [Streptomyces albus]